MLLSELDVNPHKDIFLSRSEFPTTEMELAAIANAANAGFKSQPKNGYKTPIATGIKITL